MPAIPDSSVSTVSACHLRNVSRDRPLAWALAAGFALSHEQPVHPEQDAEAHETPNGKGFLVLGRIALALAARFALSHAQFEHPEQDAEAHETPNGKGVLARPQRIEDVRRQGWDPAPTIPAPAGARPPHCVSSAGRPSASVDGPN